jgi:hypothetical protein
MSNELATLTSLPVSAAATSLAKNANVTEYLQRVQLVTKGKYVDKGKIAPGHYGVPGAEDEIQDLGESIDVLAFAVRDKALDTTEDPPLAVYDAEDAVYQDIEERAGQKKFSPFLPISEAQAEQFGVEAQGPQPLTLRAKYIERPRYSWHAPQVTKCSTPFNNLPEIEVIVAEINKFLNPKVDGAEIVEEGDSRS